ncbi:ABC transporter ATP-binding protein [Corynebacterium kefirresidentii]|uniref:ABC transporter ATP-binding protein n=1 Tax=Corynebacterium TaxID=1716 RepID=UPI001908C5BF|nr:MULTISPECIES: ATP-binding cassette domain-containing protein [Corynebacterium]MCG7450635.1 ATP-binding cassette domain-containing protein [Corynebacterium kefirresidentii]MCG7453039.1 ATP-binding cassette domain-containing protein [Corynebacterium kefirresidentii]MDN8633824.1 ATP-binding cassette domain-containing protein [Corynebacterium kefirresidentii]MDU7566411.1 ATP-binding cassette domain-containing protein [Corynebacterium sp.]MDV2414126.1 ATP-binding cassette domain-containing prote
MAKVTFEKVNITYPGASAPTVKDLDLEIADGEFLVLVGPSGCGKSTTLRALAGLEPTSSGRITIDGKDVTNLEPGDRDIAMVFQNYALYPHLTVEQNMGFALKLAKLPKADIKSKVHAAAETLGLTDYLKRKPKDLSGGQRQRVAMGRAIVREPKAFLMDEPLSNLDAKLRVQTRAELASLQQRLGTTTIYVTHDQVEAMTMGDRVAVLKDGELQQVAPPRELYDAPANEFVAGFIGSPAMNIFDYNGGRVGVRPEKMFINKGPVGFQGVVDIVEELGAESYVYVTEGENRFVARAEGTPPQRGEDVVLTFNPREALRFDPETGRRISQD